MTNEKQTFPAAAATSAAWETCSFFWCIFSSITGSFRAEKQQRTQKKKKKRCAFYLFHNQGNKQTNKLTWERIRCANSQILKGWFPETLLQLTNHFSLWFHAPGVFN